VVVLAEDFFGGGLFIGVALLPVFFCIYFNYSLYANDSQKE
jgi:hypothetical protein